MNIKNSNDVYEFKYGDAVFIIFRTYDNYFAPMLYGKCLEDDGFALSVLLKERDDFIEWICRSNCFHTKQDCQLFCDKLNYKGETHDI